MNNGKRLMAVVGICLAVLALSVGRALSDDGPPGAQDKSLTFYLPFEKDVVAVVAGGDPQPVGKSVPGKLAEGIKGTGMMLDAATLLLYSIPGNYNNAKGSLELWVKFLSADTKRYHYLFYEQGPYKPGAEILRIFTTGATGLFYNFADARGHWSGTPFMLEELMGEWHQIVLTWDKDIGDRLYIDARFQQHRGGTTKTTVHNFQRGTKQYQEMVIGLRNTEASIILDEVKIYNRMLSEEEVIESYQALFPLKMGAKPIIFHQGKPSSVTISLTNTQDRQVKGDLKYEITNEAGDIATQGTKMNIVINQGKNVDVPVSFTPDEQGKYHITYTFSGLTNLSRSANLYALPKIEAAAKQEPDPELKLKLIKDFDCTKDYGPEEYCDDGLSQVVDSPLGKYRETGEKSFSRFAYRFSLDTPHSPYLAVLEYPDDKARIMEIMIDNKTNKLFQTIENGLITGGEFPNSNKLHQCSYLFFPPDEECTIQVMNWPVYYRDETTTPAACKSIKIYQVLAGIPSVALHNLPPPNNQRLVGYEEEDTSITRQFDGNLFGGNVTFEQMYRTLKNAADYMAFTGQNVFVHPLVHYTGTHYPSEVLSRSVSRAHLHPDFWVDLALELFHAKGIKFIPSVCFWIDPGLAKEACLGPDKEGVAQGEDTVLAVAWNGELSGLGITNDMQYDVLHPLVQRAILAGVEDILNKYGDHPAFAGLSFWIWPSNALWFASMKWGYSDRDISMFEKETGIKVPGKAPDPKRFMKRYIFLVKKDEKMREKWVAWRCKKVKDLWMEIYKRVHAKNPNFKVTAETWSLWKVNRGDYSRQDHWKPGDLKSVHNFYRNGGFDLELYKDIPNFYIGKVQYYNQRNRDEDWYWRDFEFAPASIEPFKNKGQNALWLEQDRREFDRLSLATELPGYWWKDEKGNEKVPSEKSGGIVPHGDFYLEYYAHALANFDARYISDGGITTCTLGHEEELREFIRAYRALPAECFAVFGGVDDPLCVRHRERKDGYYLYLVNREFYPVTANLSFSSQKGFDLLDLATNKRTKPRGTKNGYSTTVTVGPFRLVSLKAPAGVSLSEVSVTVPDENLNWLKQRVDSFHATLQELPKRKIELDDHTTQELEWVTREIDNALAARRYSRLRHLLDSYQVKKLHRILKDEVLRSYLTVPNKYVDGFYQPRQVTAKKAKTIPAIDSDLWEKAITADTFSEVMMFEGKFRPRPAEEKTTVSILYDENSIAFRFRCYDKEVAKIIAKQVERDGNVIERDDDSIEVFISHAKENKPYYHFMANFGRSIHDKVGGDYPAFYNPEWTIETKNLADGWLALVVIPFKALEKNPQPGDVWGINLARNQRGKYVAFRCDPKKGFHCPEYFASLKFG